MTSVYGGLVGMVVGGAVAGTFGLGNLGYFAVGSAVYISFVGCRWFAREMVLGCTPPEKRAEARKRLGW